MTQIILREEGKEINFVPCLHGPAAGTKEDMKEHRFRSWEVEFCS